MTEYRPPGMLSSMPTYVAPSTFIRCPRLEPEEGADIAILGVPLDLATTFRPGARMGPSAVRHASAQLAELKAYPWGFDPKERLRIADAGDVAFDHGRPHTIPALVELAAAELVKRDIFVLGIGGDHWVTYPLLKAQVAKHGPLALVHFDAHPDTWMESGEQDAIEMNHGTMFYRAVKDGLIVPERSVQTGIRTWVDDTMGLTVLNARQVHAEGPQAIAERIRGIVGGHKAYLTIDIDVLDPAFAPGTGTPVAGGLTFAQLQAILDGIGDLPLVAMDVVEVSPPFDHAEVTALAGATIAFEQICRMAARR
ncbi:agmatinase [Zavarzinia sp. CC-PAN008]|uniref:agmatinase n=1 Tax=Zavarzinia sp. CC-PAN008 TaxID=3243332 RepID=UPI003F748DB8